MFREMEVYGVYPNYHKAQNCIHKWCYTLWEDYNDDYMVDLVYIVIYVCTRALLSVHALLWTVLQRL